MTLPKSTHWLTILFVAYAVVCFPLREVAAEPSRPPNSSSPLTQQTEKPHVAVGAWWLEGVGAFVVTASVITLALGYGSFSDADALQKKHPDGSQNTEVQSLKDTGLTLTTVGWIALGVGAATVVAGTLWLLTARTRPVRTAVSTAQHSSLSPVAPNFPSATSQAAPTILLFESP